MTWRDKIAVHPDAEMFPMGSDAEIKELAEDIKKNGLLYGVTIWTDGRNKPWLVDGRRRMTALELAGVDVFDKNGHVKMKYQHDSWMGGDLRDVHSTVLALNILRRHLTAEQKRELIAKLLKAKPETSDRIIAKQTKVCRVTVGETRAKLELRGEIPHVEKRTDTKGRKQPANKAKAAKAKVPQPEAPAPPANVIKRDDLMARRLIKEIALVEVTRLSDAAAFGQALIDKGNEILATLKSREVSCG